MSIEITKDEAAIYDRQIRLWGLDAQQRIGKADILIAGVRGLSDEVCKNLALAGVASITLLDHENVTEADLGAQFFLTEENIGQNKAEASAPSIRNLNPRVKVVVDQQNICEKSDEFFESFAVVCLVHSNYLVMDRVDKLRRKVNKPFYASDAFGWFGYIFCDLGEHTYIYEEKPDPKAERRKPEKTTMTESYKSFEESLCRNWSDLRPKALKKISPVAFLTHLLLKFQKDNNRSPTKDDSGALIVTKAKYLSAMGVEDTDLLNDSYIQDLSNLFDTEITSIAATVGGILAQDILRTISANELPICNWFYLDGKEGSGSVHIV
ncbi:hypothetical protein MFLAVUS_006270 [Mucor flavus]|uniref:Ubiquitin-like 1-activating enzyme E1A n=1 Tax=Mucor flavus TaxID=439312 RepID=A0ABP9Z150_9FUNG